MKTNDSFISRFSPNRTNPDDLEKIHVERGNLFRDALERTRKSILGKKRKHLLFVGSRGSGKTHLLSLLVHRLKQEGETMEKVRIAWLNEDETSISYADLLVRIYRALSATYSDEFSDEPLDQAFDLGPEKAPQYLEGVLKKQMKKRKLLVLVENFDALLTALKEDGQREWRAFIQDSGMMIVVATAQRMVDGLTEATKRKGTSEKLAGEEKAFYGFFVRTNLPPFGVDEAKSLLVKLARLKGDDPLEEFLQSRSGRARVRALHHLSGGNPRLYIVLSEFITRESFDELVRPFEEMIDERLTPYYQERLRWLSPQQRRLVEVLCQAQGSITVAELAKKAFAAENTTSSQLKKLREMGYVESTKDKRESYYELREPLMRLSMQVKEARDGEPLALIIDFLKVWFDREELEETMQDLGPDCFAAPYLKAALESLISEGPILRHSLLRKDIESLDRKNCSPDERQRIYELAGETGELDDLVLAWQVAFIARDCIEILEFGERLLNCELEDHACGVVHFGCGLATSQRGENKRAFQFYDNAIKLGGTNTLILSFSLLGRAGLSDPKSSAKDYERIIELEDISPDIESLAKWRYFISLLTVETIDEAMGFFKENLAEGLSIFPSEIWDFLQFGFFVQAADFWDSMSREFLKSLSVSGQLSLMGEELVKLLHLRGKVDDFLGKVESYYSRWYAIGGEYSELQIGFRMLRAGIDHLSTGERKPLLALAKEERSLVEQLLEESVED